jgi:hypothetical protein
VIAPDKASTEPTDKSIPAVSTISVIPTEMQILTEIWRITFQTLEKVRNLSDRILNARQSRNRAIRDWKRARFLGLYAIGIRLNACLVIYTVCFVLIAAFNIPSSVASLAANSPVRRPSAITSILSEMARISGSSEDTTRIPRPSSARRMMSL